MVDVNEAKAIAKQHLTDNPIDHPDYRWKTVTPREREDGWVFEYQYECTANIPPEAWEHFGGSPGFLVRRTDGAVIDLKW